MDALTKLDVLKSLYADPGELDGVLDKLLDLALSQQRGRLERYERDLSAFETRHGMASAEFYRRFSAGELGDNLDWFEWAGLYELREELLLRMQQLESAS